MSGPWWWVTLDTGAQGCAYGETREHAKENIAFFRDEAITDVKELPYEAAPRIDGGLSVMPLCYSPKECAGRSSCPKRRSCSE